MHRRRGAAAWSAARSLVAYFCSPKSENFWSMPTRSTAPAALPAATTPMFAAMSATVNSAPSAEAMDATADGGGSTSASDNNSSAAAAAAAAATTTAATAAVSGDSSAVAGEALQQGGEAEAVTLPANLGDSGSGYNPGGGRG